MVRKGRKGRGGSNGSGSPALVRVATGHTEREVRAGLQDPNGIPRDHDRSFAERIMKIRPVTPDFRPPVSAKPR